MFAAQLFFYTAGQFLRLSWQTFFPSPGIKRPSLKRVMVMLVFLPLFAIVQLIHWLGFLLDELFFRGYHQVQIKEPVFVLGVPRSGTTFLHRVLAKNAGFTTFTTWECFFAPSIIQRKFWLGIAKVDRRIGRPLARSLNRIGQHLLAGLDGIHPTRMNATEEDYLALMPILASFILILPFPHGESIWRMGSFDRDLPEKERKKIMAYYKACLQKHLYVHGTNKRLLSKNAAFASLAGSLCKTFPDGRFLCCMRDPLETLPSQLSAIKSGIELFDAESQGPVYKEKMLALFPYYYTHLLETFPALAPGRHEFLRMTDLQKNLYETVSNTLEKLTIKTSPDFPAHLEKASEQAANYVTRHHYSMEGAGLSEAEIKRLFKQVYDKYDFASTGLSEIVAIEAPRATHLTATTTNCSAESKPC